ncbi:hypothetical protein IMZ48_13650, partial [Candidatus Bathyarchaeota archaeon]|nr:hypothetical protein [Candidatus Bathyarchaeota archaeon]
MSPHPHLGETKSPAIKKARRAPESGGAESPAIKKAKHAPRSTRTSPGGPPSDSGRTPVPSDGRTITFDEIYQGGKAKHKHAILTQNPVPAGKYYMLKCECDDHTVHFGGYKSALQGAAKHLDIPFHQLPRSYQAALDHLGYEVLGCDPAKQAANNEVFEKALREGYIPHNTRTTRKSFGNYGTPQTKAAPPAVEPTTSSTTRITRPRGGELYYAWWKDDNKFYLCMIIPWDNDRDFGLTEIRKGLHGLGLFGVKLTKVPKCYNINCDLDPPKIVGWAEGYE